MYDPPNRPDEAVRQRYERALESFVERLKTDRNVIGAVLYGSLAYDVVWHKSDIDMLIIVKDDKQPSLEYTLVEDGINIHAGIESRSRFRADLEAQLEGDFGHSLLQRSRWLFCTDDTLRAYYDNPAHFGSADRQWRLLRAASSVLPVLYKAEKWLVIKRDPTYCFLWLMYAVDYLARIEVLRHGVVPGREVINQALTINPVFFRRVYTDLIHGPKDPATLAALLEAMDAYILDHVPLLFGPIFDYLVEAGGTRTTSEMDAFFRKKIQAQSLLLAYEWLADKGLIRKVSAPLHLTRRSLVTVDEAAYYYDGEH